MSENLPVPFSARVPFSFGFVLSLPQSLGRTWYIIGLFIVLFAKMEREYTINKVPLQVICTANGLSLRLLEQL